jgi:DNA polymerase II small subunit
MEKKEIVKLLLENGVLITEEIVAKLSDFSVIEHISQYFAENESAFAIAKTKELFSKPTEGELSVKLNPRVEVLFSYQEESKKRDVSDFTAYFNKRLIAIEKILSKRQELSNITSIHRIKQKRDRETVAFIGMVANKETTKNGNIIITMEDTTDRIKVLVNKTKPELVELAKNIVNDEVIGIVGVNSSESIMYANEIIQPDIPLSKELRKTEDEVYALFLSDLHVGSNKFLSEEFTKFLKWINGDIGSDSQREIIQKIGYIFIAGDLVDGVSIYPNQDNELVIKDVYDQYEECAKLLSKIPRHIKIILCPGNHDAMRIAEPQPEFYKDFSKALYDIPNAIKVSNPALVNIHKSEGFPGIDVLLYHGYSFDHYVANVDYLRENKGYQHPDLIMKFLLQRRHLAPTHSSTLYIPDANKDNLVIDRVPDIFVTGHIHKCSVASYRNVTLICGSCWQAKTVFQEKVGHEPEPCRVPIVNLQTRQVRILKF